MTLTQVPLFLEAHLTAAHMVQLARAAVEMTFEAAEPLCRKGDDALSLFALVEGSCVAKNEPDALPEFTFVMEATSTFGESALSSDDAMRTRAASVYAGERGCTVLAFSASAIEAVVGFVLQKHTALAFNRKLLAPVKLGERPITEGLSEVYNPNLRPSPLTSHPHPHPRPSPDLHPYPHPGSR